MNIGVDIRPLMSKSRTGVGEYTYELLNAVFKLDKTNQYFLLYNSRKDVSANIPRWEQENVHYVWTKWPNILLNTSIGLFGFPKLDHLRFLRKQESNNSNIKSYLCKNQNVEIFFSSNLNFVALSKKTKFILTIHDLSFKFFSEFFTPKQRLWHYLVSPKKQCERADIILTPSENTKRDIVDYYKIPTDKIRVIYPGLASAFDYKGSFASLRMTNEKAATADKKYILFLGTIEPRKNIPGLIKAFEIFNIRYPISNIQLFVAGAPGWKNKEIFEMINKSPCKEKINYIGCVKSEEKAALYSNASLFVYPSFYEGFGFPVLEAMASGVPVITSNRSSLPEISDSSAALIDPNHPEQIASAMHNILSNKNLRETQIKNGLNEAAKFSWEKAAKEWLSLIETQKGSD